MRKPFRLLAAVLVCCMVAGMLPPVSFAVGAREYSLDEAQREDLLGFIESSASDGDIINLGGTAYVKGGSTDEPWIIKKAVTIQGGSIVIRRGGVLLGADVTFSNVTVNFTSNIRNAMIANGHTLTLENVTAEGKTVDNVPYQNMSFNLFCGTLIPKKEQFGDAETFDVPEPGDTGRIVIKGATSLQNVNTYGPGNIYAGSLCTGGLDGPHNGADANGPGNQFEGNAEIVIEGAKSSTALGTIYACGAQQRIPVGAQSGKVMLPNPDTYTVKGTVTIRGKVPDVAGAGAGNTSVVYNGGNNQATQTWTGLSSLTIEAGNVMPKPGSSLREGADLAVADGATLNITDMGSPLTVNNFTGGGSLILGKSQQLYINGNVEGTTAVGVGNSSTTKPSEDHIYIQADKSTDNSFELIPYSAKPELVLKRQSDGSWMIIESEEVEKPKLRNFTIDDTSIQINQLDDPSYDAVMKLTTTFVDPQNAPLIETFPLSIEVNGEKAEIGADDMYTAPGILRLTTEYNGVNEILRVRPAKAEAGRYEIKITIPGEHTESGQPLTATGTLTVGNPDPTTIPIPQGNSNLTWTGEVQTGVKEGTGYTLTDHTGTDAGDYEATATLKDGYLWEGGTKDPVKIPWRIGKAEGPELPAGVVYGTAPTTENGSDGKINGTTTDMEYADNEEFTDAKDCADGATTGLPAGTYYVRFKETKNQEAGKASEIIVPAYGTPVVDSI